MRVIKRIWQRISRRRTVAAYADPFVSKNRVAEHFEVSTRTVERWMAHGCPLLRLNGGPARFRLREVEDWHRNHSPSVDRAVDVDSVMSTADVI